MVGFAAREQDKKRMGLPKAHGPKKASAPFLVEEKQALTPPSFRTNPKGRVAVVQMSPDWEGQRLLGHVPIGRDKAKSRWFSKSKSVCAGGSGKVPRLCAI